jgi:hypothetical protein
VANAGAHFFLKTTNDERYTICIKGRLRENEARALFDEA